MLGRTGLAIGALTALQAIGCATTATGPAPCAPPREAWNELRSTHFVMRTDMPKDDARAAVVELERIYAAFEDVAFPRQGDPNDRIDVVLFAREADYGEFGPTPSTAYFTPSLPNDLEPVPTMVMHGALAPQTRLTLQHELTHHFVHRILGWAPPWLNEGLAQYYSTLRVERGHAFFGDPLPDHGLSRGSSWRMAQNGAFRQVLVPIDDIPPVEEIVGASRSRFYRWKRGEDEPTLADRRQQSAFYTGSWALVHMLQNGPEMYRHRFDSFMELVTRGTRPKLAWRRTFWELGKERIEADFRLYLKQRDVALRKAEYKPRASLSELVERPVSGAEVLVLRSRLRPWKGRAKLDLARCELDGAAAIEATGEVHFWRGMFAVKVGRREDAERELSRALAAKPDHPEYLLALASLHERDERLVPPAKRRAGPGFGYVQRLAKVAKTSTELNFVGRYYAEVELPDQGIPFAERAVAADPTCWRCLDSLAMLQFQQKKVDEALATQERAVSAMPETMRNMEVIARLRQYQDAVRQKGGDAEDAEGSDE